MPPKMHNVLDFSITARPLYRALAPYLEPHPKSGLTCAAAL
jgi:hypothetical protein